MDGEKNPVDWPRMSDSPLGRTLLIANPAAHSGRGAEGAEFARRFLESYSAVTDGYDVRLNFERDKYFEVDPYTEQAYNLYINIPDKLAEMFETASFTIGFKDDMSIPTTTYGSDGSVTEDIDQQYVFTSGLTNAG